MTVLLLRLAGPMQSWGVQSRFPVRDTGLEPSKSGVIGLICAALGRPRSAPVADLAALRMGVRVDQEGKLSADFQTAGMGGILASDGKTTATSLVIGPRYYLADARFLVGVEGTTDSQEALLDSVQDALQHPVWPLYLGRKAFVPGEPVRLADGLRRTGGLLDVLSTYPWIGRIPGKGPSPVRIVLEDEVGSEVRPDVPVSFAERTFARRNVSTLFAPFPAEEASDVPRSTDPEP